ncbi:PREDICTED: uncharacterized protein LOC105447799 [Wasmannia auropunctata]|uniref:uncharacterized protein LOC105447799 n=1 Tax=Wasmannia auropunctata TaxID=64793 RepID=UPI0005EE71C6|nr:PREDICTED: uncharacterized protein LOC105447799 [Wasmannia auropunctata]
MVGQWSKKSREPNLKWEKTEVEIIKFAHDFAQGERRISRYEKTLYVQSSSEYGDLGDSENDECEEISQKRTQHDREKSPRSNNNREITINIKDLEIMLKEQNVRRRQEEIKAKMVVRSHTLTGQSEIDLQKELGLDKPFETLEKFVVFDNRLKDDDFNLVMVFFITLG